MTINPDNGQMSLWRNDCWKLAPLTEAPSELAIPDQFAVQLKEGYNLSAQWASIGTDLSKTAPAMEGSFGRGTDTGSMQ